MILLEGTPENSERTERLDLPDVNNKHVDMRRLLWILMVMTEKERATPSYMIPYMAPKSSTS